MTTLVVGAGLSGLALADHLMRNGEPVTVLDARDRIGGRILSTDAGLDLGPAWFWPGQPRMARMVARFGLVRFDQHASGDLMFEDERGAVQRGRGFASMEGSWRLDGGLGRLVQALRDALPDDAVRLNAQVVRVERTKDGVHAVLANGERIAGDRIVLALPPRIASTIEYAPALGADLHGAMDAVPTWMAGQAKAVAVYERPFWREEGLSGDAMSRFGPMVEIHDASGAVGEPHALFGFIGVPAAARTDEAALRDAVLAQLVRLFGEDAASPKDLIVKDWARDVMTSTALDAQPLHAHPTYGMPRALAHLWDGRLHLSGTEVAPQFGGFLEGALEAAERTFAALKSELEGKT